VGSSPIKGPRCFLE